MKHVPEEIFSSKLISRNISKDALAVIIDKANGSKALLFKVVASGGRGEFLHYYDFIEWFYLLYSATKDNVRLIGKISEWNEEEKKFNNFFDDVGFSGFYNSRRAIELFSKYMRILADSGLYDLREKR